MKRTLLTALLIAAAAVAVVPARAWAEYDALQGRFLQRDSAEYAATTPNLYQAMDSNPLKKADPTGHMAEGTAGAIELGYSFYIPEALAGAGAKAFAEVVAGAATARNLAVSLAICTVQILQTNAGVASWAGDKAASVTSEIWKEIVRFASNSSDRSEGFRESFRNAMNNSGSWDPNDPWEKHHQLPKEFEDKFQKVDLDIEDFTIDLPKSLHRLKPDGLHTGTGADNWNGAWREFFDEHGSNYTKQDVLDNLAKLQEDFGLAR